MCVLPHRGGASVKNLDVQPSTVAKEQSALGHALVVGASLLCARRDEAGRHTAVDRCVCSLQQTTTTASSSWLHSSAPQSAANGCNSELLRIVAIVLPHPRSRLATSSSAKTCGTRGSSSNRRSTNIGYQFGIFAQRSEILAWSRRGKSPKVAPYRPSIATTEVRSGGSARRAQWTSRPWSPTRFPVRRCQT